MFQSAIGRGQFTQSFQKLGHSRPVADSPRGFGRGSPVLKRGIVQQQDQSRDSLLVASQANGVDRDLADRFVRIEEARGDHDPRRRMTARAIAPAVWLPTAAVMHLPAS